MLARSALARVTVAPLVLLAEAVVVAVSPLLALVAALLRPLGAGRRALRMLVVAVDYCLRHLACSAACAVLWVASGFGRRAGSPRMQRAHYAVLGWFVGGVYRSITRQARVDVRVVESGAAEAALAARDRPAVVLSRHAGEGDTLLVLHHLVCRYRRRPHLVLHEALRLDPLIDALGRRLPNRFVDPRGGDTEKDIADMAGALGDDGAVLIFPEGGNFSHARRQKGISRLEHEGHAEEAARAREMTHVSAPRPGGTLAAIEAAPAADVFVVGFAGIPIGFGELWRRLDHPQTVEVKLWHIPAEEIPDEREAQIDWLFGCWRALDGWVAERGP